jgi:hypothetical protein
LVTASRIAVSDATTRLDVQAGAELDVVHREDVGGNPSSPSRERVAIRVTGMTLYLPAFFF